MRKHLNLIFIVLVLLTLLALPLGTALTRPDAYSIFENRSLADSPSGALSPGVLLDREFYTGLETWYKDHVAARNAILRAYTVSQMALGKPAVNGIITCEGSLLPVVDPKYPSRAPDSEIAAEVAELSALKQVTESYGGHLLYMGVPGQITMFADSYPDCLQDTPSYFRETAGEFARQLEAADIAFLDGWSYLTPDMYYRVDHHFGVTGGWAVYEKLCEFAGVDAVDREHFNFYRLPNPFYGSRNRKIYDITPVKDKLEVFDMDFELPFDRWDNGVQVASEVIPMPKNSQAIVTENYMGGDIPQTVIKTYRPELPNLLIYGDSYTNAVECFAYLSFNETHSLDLRHYDEMSLCEYVELYRPDYVVCIRDDGNYASIVGNGKLT